MFQVRAENKHHRPHPFLIWMALSMWGYDLTQSESPFVIHLIPEGHFFGRTDRLYVNDTLSTINISINTGIVKYNGLFFNILVHELGHARGLSHPTGHCEEFTCVVMKYTVHIRDGLLEEKVPYIWTPRRALPFHPFDKLNYSGNFYDF